MLLAKLEGGWEGMFVLPQFLSISTHLLHPFSRIPRTQGVELYYFDGEQCEGGVARDVRVQFFCDPDAGAGKPLDYYVLEEDCHYSITWPSKYGCPATAGVFFGGLTGWGVVGWFVAVAAAYIGGGCAYNVARRGAALGPEALPHPEFWRELPGLVADGVQACRAIAAAGADTPTLWPHKRRTL